MSLAGSYLGIMCPEVCNAVDMEIMNYLKFESWIKGKALGLRMDVDQYL